MSSDIYIPLSTVLSQPRHFQFKTELNVDVDTARAEAATDEPDWAYVQYCLKPVLLCKFGAREIWSYVEIFDGTSDLHICCSGDFRTWLMEWLNDHNYGYIII